MSSYYTMFYLDKTKWSIMNVCFCAGSVRACDKFHSGSWFSVDNLKVKLFRVSAFVGGVLLTVSQYKNAVAIDLR